MFLHSFQYTRVMRFLLLFFAACFWLAAQQPAASASSKSALDKEALGRYVSYYLLWDPRIQVQVGDPVASTALPGFQEVKVRGTLGPASEERLFYISKDGQKILSGTVLDMGKSPFQAELDKLKTQFQPSFGTPGAPVVLVVFSDFQCQYCREEAKVMRENLLKAYPDKVRVYFKDFPLEQIHAWAKPAAVAGRCVFRQEPAAFWDYHDWIFENQTSITADNLKPKVQEWAATRKLDAAQLNGCLDIQATKAEVERSIEEARALQINSTPTTFLNGRRFSRHLTWPELKAYIDFELENFKKTGQGGESACCEVKLPTPGQE